MTLYATGVAKQVILAKEVTEGANPGTGGKTLRRVSSELTLSRDGFESQEILSSQQVRDARLGTRRVQGTFAGQLSGGSFNDFWEGILRSTWTTGVVLASTTLAFDNTAGTLTLSGGGLNAAGFKREDVVTVTGAGTPNAGLNGARLRISALSDTVATVLDLPTGLTTGSLAGVTLTVVGKKLFIPASGQLYPSYTMEHWFSDLGVSEAYVGCKFGATSLNIPASGLVTFSTQVTGMDMIQGSSRAITSPAASGGSNALTGNQGKVSVAGVELGIVTGATVQIAAMLGTDPTLGSNIVPHVFNGRVRVTGSMTVLFTDQTFLTRFLNETEVTITFQLAAGNSSNDFFRITIPRVKFMSDSKSDGEMSLVQSFSYTGLENYQDSTIDMSSIILQDSLA